MAKTKISEFSATPANNTDIDGINIAEGCAPSGINDAIRELMAQLKDWQSGTSNDPYVIGSSGSLTLNQGTANGVAYLNGSKVLTTGSALTFDGSQLDVPAGSASAPSLSTTADANTGIYFPAADVVGISTGGTERARVDASGNLGLGVTPSAWFSTGYSALQVRGSSIYVGAGNDTNLASNAFVNTSPAWAYVSTGTATRYEQGGGAHKWYNAASGTAGNAISFTQAMTLDASGNLGVGTTSPLIASGYTNLVVSNATNGGILYVDRPSGARGYFYANATTSVILGTAGSYPLVFNTADTERARIDSSGNVGIGTSSPSGRLNVAATAATNTTGLNLTGSTTGYQRVLFSNNTGGGQLGVEGSSGGTIATGTTAYATVVGDYAGKPLQFLQNNSVRATIDTSGNLLVGTTSQIAVVNARVFSTHGQADYTQAITNSHPSQPFGLFMRYTVTAPNNTSSAFIYADDSSNTQRFSVRSNGGVYNFSGNNSNLSDRREKTNFAPAGNYLSKICAIPVQTFNYIDQNMEEDPGLTLGVVAQDVQAVAPELVMESNWGTQEEPKQRLSIYQTDLQYALMKCIQEQQAIITALTARVEALESN